MLTPLRLASALLCCPLVLWAEDYRFSHEGQPVFPKIYPVEGPRMGLPAEGDLAVVFDFAFVLGEPGHYQLRFDSPLAAQLFCRIDAKPEHTLAVRTSHRGAGSEVGVANPLLEMTEQEKRSLRGVRLDVDPQDWEASFSGIDWSRCALELRNIDYPVGGLPAALRYLRLAPSQPVEDHGFARLSELASLRYLYVQLSHNAFPLSVLTESQEAFVNLEIDGTAIRDVSALANLRSLRFVKLRKVKGLESLDWAGSLEELKVLKVDDSAVSDLQAVVKLPNLRLLSVNGTQVTSLPAPGAFPALLDFRLHSTPAAEDKKQLAPYRPVMNVSVKDWDEAIGKFEREDSKHRTKEAVLFVGSSSIRGWNLREAFPEWNTRNRGFGGSELSDALIHYDKIVLPNLPMAILVYAGDNDIANGETAEQVVADWKKFVERTAKKLPGAHVAYLPIKPSLKRWELWPEMKKANDSIGEMALSDPRWHFLDTATPMLGEDGKPKPSLFANDGLHLNEAGYRVWNAVVRAWLERFPKSNS